MEVIKKSTFKSVDEIISLMKERKRVSKIENQQLYHTKEYQGFLKKLRSLKNSNHK